MKSERTTLKGMLSAEPRAAAKEQITAVVNTWLKGFIDEAFELADHNDARVNWNNLGEVADHACGLLALYSHHEICDGATEILTTLMVPEDRT